MRNRWSVLAVLFFIRTTMAVQFQSVAAIAPLLSADFDVSLADIGILVGLYSVPGVVLALPGGAIGQRFGDKNTVVLGLILMMAGSCIMALSTSWGGQISGRLVAGVGGVLMSVLMTKMVADWFIGKELSTAMAIFVNSWPVGIAISLLAAPTIAMLYGASGGVPGSGGLDCRRHGPSRAVLSFAPALHCHENIEWSPGSPRRNGGGLCGIDMGPVQHGVRNGFQLRSHDAG